MDYRLIGMLVERLVEPHMSWSDFAESCGVSRATVYRLRDGDPRVTRRTLRRMEPALTLRYDTLSAVGEHDWTRLEDELSLDAEVITWLKQRAHSP